MTQNGINFRFVTKIAFLVVFQIGEVGLSAAPCIIDGNNTSNTAQNLVWKIKKKIFRYSAVYLNIEFIML